MNLNKIVNWGVIDIQTKSFYTVELTRREARDYRRSMLNNDPTSKIVKMVAVAAVR